MGKIVIPKNSALLEEIEAAIKIYYEAGGWVTNKDLKAKLKGMIGDDQYESSYTKKIQVASYYGFVEWQDVSNKQSPKRITESGRSFYEHVRNADTTGVLEDLMSALETVTFGRNNHGCPDTDSDVEPPAVFIQSIIALGYITYEEFSYILWVLEDCAGNYKDAIRNVSESRLSDTFKFPKESNKYDDPKAILALRRWGFVDEITGKKQNMRFSLNPVVGQKYLSRLRKLKIYNVERKSQNGDDALMTENSVKTYALDDPRRVKGGVNVLLYGVPGCGKSHEIKTKYCNDKKYMERVVFHPDYTYSDFVGQILPKTDGATISYPFTKGPFTTILRKAICDPEHMYYLVIEEINRGNAPAIFGEVFQLLDREDGTSEYGINNYDIAKCVYGTGKEEEEIKIPSNLTILATMNTADQNVFTLDTAFKRRWSMRCIENNIDACDHATHKICGTSITWQAFASKINDTIIDIGEGNLSSEDNRLGAYFVKADDLLDEKAFAEKVLMYLWNDAFKYDHDKVFKSEYRTLEELLKGFYAVKFDVFHSHLGFDNQVSVMPTTSTTSESEYLVNKNQGMIQLYTKLRDNVLNACPDLEVGSTASKGYLIFYAASHSKKSFANLYITSNRIRVFTKEPIDTTLKSLGQNITGNYNYHFEISVDDSSDLKLVADAIIDSYHQCI